jgi:hypothetical protein
MLRHWVGATVDGRMIPHTIGVDEEGKIFDPANGAPHSLLTNASLMGVLEFTAASWFATTGCDIRRQALASRLPLPSQILPKTTGFIRGLLATGT